MLSCKRALALSKINDAAFGVAVQIGADEVAQLLREKTFQTAR